MGSLTMRAMTFFSSPASSGQRSLKSNSSLPNLQTLATDNGREAEKNDNRDFRTPREQLHPRSPVNGDIPRLCGFLIGMTIFPGHSHLPPKYELSSRGEPVIFSIFSRFLYQTRCFSVPLHKIVILSAAPRRSIK